MVIACFRHLPAFSHISNLWLVISCTNGMETDISQNCRRSQTHWPKPPTQSNLIAIKNINIKQLSMSCVETIAFQLSKSQKTPLFHHRMIWTSSNHRRSAADIMDLACYEDQLMKATPPRFSTLGGAWHRGLVIAMWPWCIISRSTGWVYPEGISVTGT